MYIRQTCTAYGELMEYGEPTEDCEPLGDQPQPEFGQAFVVVKFQYVSLLTVLLLCLVNNLHVFISSYFSAIQ